MVSKFKKGVNLLIRDIVFELWLGEKKDEVWPRNFPKPLRVKLVKQISPFVFEEKLFRPEILFIRTGKE